MFNNQIHLEFSSHLFPPLFGIELPSSLSLLVNPGKSAISNFSFFKLAPILWLLHSREGEARERERENKWGL
jgi:hypothetical protein